MNTLSVTQGGARNLRTPLKRPCEKALDAQAETDELQTMLAAVTDLGAAAQFLAGAVLGAQAVLRPLQRQLQLALEAERAVREGRHA